ncbi:hypothetical protein KGQ71_04070 [Patescibacteria group bacterium]|nr:hypothetical protein [Patescibacteria group bacterium]
MNASEQVKIVKGDYLATLKNCGGYYACPKDTAGKRLGPLVGYTGRYETADGEKKQFVGEVFYNHAVIETYPAVMDYFAADLAQKMRERYGAVDYVIGPAMGGIIIAQNLSRHLDCLFAYAEKKVVALATKTEREREVLVLKRHEVKPGTKVVLVEDICNNFSTTAQLIELVEGLGTTVIGLAAITNASGKTAYPYGDRALPLVALVEKETIKYRQDDPAVAEDISRGNVVWKPKHEWGKLLNNQALAKST